MIALCEYVILCLCKTFGDIPISWPLKTMVVYMWTYVFLFLLSIYVGMELLGHTVSLNILMNFQVFPEYLPHIKLSSALDQDLVSLDPQQAEHIGMLF